MADHFERLLSNPGGVVTRSLCHFSSIALGVLGSVLLASAGTGMAQGAEAHLIMGVRMRRAGGRCS